MHTQVVYPGHHESDTANMAPISPSKCNSMQLSIGPKEGTKEHQELADEVGYSYRQVLGELMYAYVIARCDIGYAVTFLARFAQHPSKEHYVALKGVAKYLRATKQYGIYYWREKERPDLPHCQHAPPRPDNDDLPPFPTCHGNLTCDVDAAHATDLCTRRSVTGYAICYAGRIMAYKSKLQATCSTSSTKAKFITSVTAAKAVKYL